MKICNQNFLSINVPITSVKTLPSIFSETETQCLFGEKVKIKHISQKKGLFSFASGSAKIGSGISIELIDELENRHLWARFGM